MSGLISETPRPNRITDVSASKFDLSVVAHSEARLFEKQEEKEGGVTIVFEREARFLSITDAVVLDC